MELIYVGGICFDPSRFVYIRFAGTVCEKCWVMLAGASTETLFDCTVQDFLNAILEKYPEPGFMRDGKRYWDVRSQIKSDRESGGR